VPRALWNGSLSFGLVNVPVRLASAARDLDLHFRQLHEKDGAPIEQRRFCTKEDKEVDWEEVGRGFDLEDGGQVVLTDEQLATAQPRKTRTIDIEAFVDLEDVDPIYFDHPWFLVPSGESEGTLRAYQLLVKVMESTDRAALGRFVMRTKEYLVLVRPRDGLLALTTLLFHDEVRPTREIAPGGRKPAKRKVDQAVAVIESLAAEWEPERYTDCYRERLTRVVQDKKKGRRVKAPEKPREPKPAPDLMAALQETLDAMGGARKGGARKGGGADGGARDGAGEKDRGRGGERDRLDGLSREQLYERAQAEDVPGRSKMSRDELAEALGGD
jgi:DNA end-binding protein Ku